MLRLDGDCDYSADIAERQELDNKSLGRLGTLQAKVPKLLWSHRKELHLRPLAYEASALLSELLRHRSFAILTQENDPRRLLLRPREPYYALGKHLGRPFTQTRILPQGFLSHVSYEADVVRNDGQRPPILKCVLPSA